MRIFRFLGRFAKYALVAVWAPAWLAAWWFWPPAPRSGWQISAGERSCGFLSDSKHVVTEERTAASMESHVTGKVHVRNIETGAMAATYTTDANARCHLQGDVLVEYSRLKEKPLEYPPGGDVGAEEAAGIRARNAWTGEILFEENRVYGFVEPCRQHALAAYVRRGDPAEAPETVWRDLKSGRIVKTFPGVAGPIAFSADGSRFLAARWRPEATLEVTLLLVSVPEGEVLHSMPTPCDPQFRFMPRLSGDGRRVLAQGDVLDLETGATLIDDPASPWLGELSTTGRYVIDPRFEADPALVWRSATTGEEEFRLGCGLPDGGTSSSWMRAFDGENFHWVCAGRNYSPKWRFPQAMRWLARWLPVGPHRTDFVIAERDTGRLILQGVGYMPMSAAPDGQLLIVREVRSGRERLWNIPPGPGLPWPVAAAGGLALPAFLLWRRWRRAAARQPAHNHAGV